MRHYSMRAVAAAAFLATAITGASTAVAKPRGATVTATFIIKNANTKLGQNVYVVGDQPALGKWTPANGLPLKVHGSGKSAVWEGSTMLPAGASVQYKYVKWDGKNADWEADEATKSKNREVRMPPAGHAVFNDHAFKPQKP